MPVLADTKALVTDAVITPDQATEIESRARQLMVNAGINGVLCLGILAATLGLIFFLADPLSVAIIGSLLLGGGLFVLLRSADIYRMFGNAAALIGSGMLIGGAGIELISNYERLGGWAAVFLALPIVFFAGRSLLIGGLTARFVAGSILLMGAALHLSGVAFLAADMELSGLPVMMLYFYAAAVIAAAGWVTDVKTITALAIVPFAQMLDTSTFYFHAAYAFYSPESTLSIIQMGVLIAAALWATDRFGDRTNRHLGITVIMAFVVANLCALVGSLFGDIIGSHFWGPHGQPYSSFENWEAREAARDAFEATALTLSAEVYSILWALVLIGMVFWAGHKNKRGLFNASVTFLAIHAYTQAFESFYDEPLAYVIGGFTLIPVAWGMWRLNQRFTSQERV